MLLFLLVVVVAAAACPSRTVAVLSLSVSFAPIKETCCAAGLEVRKGEMKKQCK